MSEAAAMAAAAMAGAAEVTVESMLRPKTFSSSGDGSRARSEAAKESV
jgi:hypothetical protein